MEGKCFAHNVSCEEDCEERVLHSRKKLEDVAASLAPWIISDNIRCIFVTSHDVNNYRCRCTFQCIFHPHSTNMNVDCISGTGNKNRYNNQRLSYAVRRNFQPIRMDHFPVASRRIQNAMSGFLHFVNGDDNNNSRPSNDILENLTSITFSSSWSGIESSDKMDGGKMTPYSDLDYDDDYVRSDCVVTLHYDAPISNIDGWKAQALDACNILRLNQLIGRSRKRIVFALDRELHHNASDPGYSNCILRDRIWVVASRDSAESEKIWKVGFRRAFRNDNEFSNSTETIEVLYEKPDGAFYHPNSRVMCRALEWMLNCISKIVSDVAKQKREEAEEKNVIETDMTTSNTIHLLEMYCGCGAHTVALAQTNLLTKIVAIELDERLVKACKRNCEINNIPVNGCYYGGRNNPAKDNLPAVSIRNNRNYKTPIDIVSADAGRWARENIVENSNNHHHLVDILLVDPPREGLSQDVCDMALQHNFHHMLYISCGKDALVRDIQRLSSHYEVIDCQIHDLFPGTISVESLIHMRRKVH